MQKVYLLLRNNQQTGPHTFEELLQLQLKPHDLIWIEGKSYGWRYPAEVESLKPYMTTTDVPKKETEQAPFKSTDTSIVRDVNSKKVFVSMPVNLQPQMENNAPRIDPIEQKAEELSRRTQASTPQYEETKTNYSRDVDEAEEDYTKWIYEKKTKKKPVMPKKILTVAGIGVLTLLSGWWVKEQFFKTSAVTNIAPIAEQNNSPVPEDIETNNETIAEKQNSSVKKLKPNQKAEKTKKEKSKTKVDEIIVQKETPASETSSRQEEQAIEPTTNINGEEKNNETVAQTPAEKKKTFKEKVSDLFKNKKENAPEEEPRAAENNNNERKATRREEENTVLSVTDVSDQVEIKTNKIAESWMMGVKNVKLTLYNRSNLTVTTAKVEVLYYSDQNNLLEKKVVAYTNVPPKKSQTVAIPDNRLADHIDYKVLSATGVENAYANR